MAGVMGEGLALLATDLHALAEMLDALDADGDLQQMNSHDTLTAVSTSAPGQPGRPAGGRAGRKSTRRSAPVSSGRCRSRCPCRPAYRRGDRKSTSLNSSHECAYRMPSYARNKT